MDNSLAISVQGVAKKYRLYSLPRQRLLEALHPFRKQYHREFWALQDISFEVPCGTTLGIIGRNGSGKSTLLQVICGILRPTAGTVETSGRIAALLELGAGFNPQFTGRENAIFSGQLTGLSSAEIRSRLPAIEAFADIGEFIDQPVKTYSSGMFVRLAFACAINVDPSILIIDEALAVGDVKFQEKCFRKFREFQDSGKTIVFVTHDDQAVAKFCDRAVLLDQGRLICHDSPTRTIRRYYDILGGRQQPPQAQQEDPAPSGGPEAVSIETESVTREAVSGFLANQSTEDICSRRANYNSECYSQRSDQATLLDYLIVSGESVDPNIIDPEDTVEIYVKARFFVDLPKAFFGLSLKTKDGVTIYALNSAWLDIEHPSPKAGDVITVKFAMPFRLHAGTYFFDIGVDALWTPGCPANPACAGTERPYYSVDRRVSLAYVMVRQHQEFHGMVDLQASFEQISSPQHSLCQEDM